MNFQFFPEWLFNNFETLPAIPSAVDCSQTSCTIPAILDLLEVDTPVFIDDGKIQARVILNIHFPMDN
jgi:pyruvate kinase